jgi:hypothetical protein
MNSRIGDVMLDTAAAVLKRARPGRERWALVVGSADAGGIIAEIAERFSFYFPGWILHEHVIGGDHVLPRARVVSAALNQVPVLYAGQHDPQLLPGPLRNNPRYWLNPGLNGREAWEWHELVAQQFGHRVNVEASKRRFLDFERQNGLRAFKKCYVFGTGPSLARAIEKDWSDGVRVVCNTIVRDHDLWHHIQPHIIVAADAGYHFSFTDHACAFRSDLKKRLTETDAIFMYPDEFDVVVLREFEGLEDRLVPVPQGDFQDLVHDLHENFAFPELHNILPRMLSIACALSQEIGLWGFDGRAPDDQGFWKNASGQSYPEHMQGLRDAYPAFFNEQIPDNDGQRYIRQSFGEALEQCLSEVEERGTQFVMMHDTWTDTLRKRQRE